MLLDGQILDVRNAAEARARLGVVADTDARLADAREPLDHTHPASDIETLSGTLSTLAADLAALEAELTGSLGLAVDGSGTALTAGLKGYVRAPYAGQITGWSLLGDQAGDAVVDIWRTTADLAPPTVADTITASAKPELATAQLASSTVLTDWTIDFSEGDIFAFNLDSVTTLTQLSIYLTTIRI